MPRSYRLPPMFLVTHLLTLALIVPSSSAWAGQVALVIKRGGISAELKFGNEVEVEVSPDGLTVSIGGKELKLRALDDEDLAAVW